MSMKDRIMQIMKMEDMTQQEFAKALDVSPASLSNIFNGKTNPTNYHVAAIHQRFPDINVNWLMFGEGDIYARGHQSVMSTSKVESETKTDSFTLASHDAGGSITPTDGGNAPMRTSEVNEERISSSTLSSDEEAVMQQGMAPTILRETIKYIDKPQRKITEIRIFFDDGTFEVFCR